MVPVVSRLAEDAAVTAGQNGLSLNKTSKYMLQYDRKEWNGMEWNGMEWNGMEWKQTKDTAVVSYPVQRDRLMHIYIYTYTSIHRCIHTYMDRYMNS